MDMYEKLQEMLDTHPSSAPRSETFQEILRMLFTPDEVALAVHMSFKPKAVEDIARSASVTSERAAGLLEAMASKVVIFSLNKNGKMLYALIPTIPGLFEFPFMKGELTPELKKLGNLWEQYHHEALGNAFSGKPTPQIRIIPISTSLDATTNVHPYEEVKKLIGDAGYLGLAHCACRVSVGKCDAPWEVCIIFGSHAKFLVERGYAREVTKEQALEALLISEQAGLVHTSNNSADKPVVICNCCPCCCTVLRGLTQLNNPNAFSKSRFEARVIGERCTGCGLCADERCFFGAVSMSGDKASVDAGRCVGCGLCVTACPAEAMVMAERPGFPEVPATAQEMLLKVMQERGTLERFMEIMQR